MNRSRILLLFVSALLISGCATFGIKEDEIVMPAVVEKTAFPTVPANVLDGDFYLKAKLVISAKGAVKQVELLNSSGDSEWDSVAAETLKQWKYSPGMQGDKPIQMDIIQVTHVLSTPPLWVHLAQILFPTKAQADSALAQLRTGTNFDSLVEKYTIPNSVLRSGNMGLVNINLFARSIRRELSRLSPEKYSSIFALGPYYVIFERVK